MPYKRFSPISDTFLVTPFGSVFRQIENGTSDSTIMAIAGHVSRRMLERYSHVRMEAKRTAMEALAVSTKTAGYDTNHDTNAVTARVRPV